MRDEMPEEHQYKRKVIWISNDSDLYGLFFSRRSNEHAGIDYKKSKEHYPVV